MTAPRVSVIVATYNHGPYIAETLESILSQSGPQVEIIVVDDASTDGTEKVLERYASRVRYVRLEKNWGGPSHPRNAGLLLASGTYVTLFDADDVMLPGKLEEQAAFLDAHPDVALVFTDFRNFSPDGAASARFLADHPEFQSMPKRALGNGWYRLDHEKAYETLLGDNFIGTGTVMFRKELLRLVGLFDESLKRSEDIDYWYRVTQKFDIGFIDRETFRRRLHGSNISSAPDALLAKLKIYRKQDGVPMTAAAQKMRRRMMGQLYYALGFAARREGKRWEALRYLANSVRFDFNGGRSVRSFLAVLFAGRPGAPTS